MFEKIGRKLARGAKAEMLESPDRLTDILEGVLKVGLFVAVLMLDGSKKKTSAQPTVIVNNYICKEEKHEVV